MSHCTPCLSTAVYRTGSIQQRPFYFVDDRSTCRAVRKLNKRFMAHSPSPTLSLVFDRTKGPLECSLRYSMSACWIYELRVQAAQGRKRKRGLNRMFLLGFYCIVVVRLVELKKKGGHVCKEKVSTKCTSVRKLEWSSGSGWILIESWCWMLWLVKKCRLGKIKKRSLCRGNNKVHWKMDAFTVNNITWLKK